MEYILTHRSGIKYKVNLPDNISFSEFADKVKSGKDILTLFNLDDTMAGVEGASFLGECVVSKNNEMPIGGKRILLPRSEELATVFIHIGSIMQNAAAKEEVVANGNKITIKEKDKDAVYDFNWDYNSVIFKYLDFLQEIPLKPSLLLTEEESELLNNTVHAAYYITGELGQINELFEKHYDKYFRKK